ncbi:MULTISPECIES: hypothetical protein [Sphingobium]|jgi:hypothetical protein|uniref:Phasin domain-containing protein n=3 Tax=Sphingobium TaxID=165695 RepID=T0J446_9SPHN|nr:MULTISPECIES: hypothetical protein [Sphingobium]EQB16744.1 hypothetical protein RLDS_06400 [Sphingobium lactosutens DS20]QDC36597.1 hypothetical protein FIL70_04390 [Sphingobium fuliginis ATCC 27551]QNG43918.1 hypothetical protein H3V42_18620 [Sphingobium yanoikuyae]
MTYPFDQFSALGKAHGQFVAALAQIARESGEHYAQISGKAAASLFEQFKDLKPGAVPNFDSEPLTSLFGEVEKSREASLEKIKSAYDDWQGACQDVFSETARGQQDLVEQAQAWLQPLINPGAITPGQAAAKSAAAARASAKTADTA